MTSLSQPKPNREFEGVDAGQFQRDIRPAHQPAVLRGLAADWPAVRAARKGDEALVDYLKRFGGANEAGILSAPPEVRGRLFYADDLKSMNFERGRAPLGEVLDRLLAARDQDSPEALAVQSTLTPRILPGFDLENRTALVAPNVVSRAWIGNRIDVVPHYDLSENIGIVVAGRRRFTLFPPDQLPNLYVGPFQPTPAGTQVSMVDPEEPDFERYPRYATAMASALRAELEPGDAIYVPYHWWHRVESLGPFNMFVNYWWNDAYAEAGTPYEALLYGLLALKPLPPEQREVWRMKFDHYVFGASGDPGAHLPPHAQGLLGPPTKERLARIRAAIKQLAAKL
jgi:hypothetical protein